MRRPALNPSGERTAALPPYRTAGAGDDSIRFLAVNMVRLFGSCNCSAPLQLHNHVRSLRDCLGGGPMCLYRHDGMALKIPAEMTTRYEELARAVDKPC